MLLRAGTKLLLKSLASCSQDPNIEEVYAHVQAGNDEALKLYQAHGFEVRETVKDYYKRLDPPDAVLVAKRLTQQAAAAAAQ